MHRDTNACNIDLRWGAGPEFLRMSKISKQNCNVCIECCVLNLDLPKTQNPALSPSALHNKAQLTHLEHKSRYTKNGYRRATAFRVSRNFEHLGKLAGARRQMPNTIYQISLSSEPYRRHLKVIGQ